MTVYSRVIIYWYLCHFLIAGLLVSCMLYIRLSFIYFFKRSCPISVQQKLALSICLHFVLSISAYFNLITLIHSSVLGSNQTMWRCWCKSVVLVSTLLFSTVVLFSTVDLVAKTMACWMGLPVLTLVVWWFSGQVEASVSKNTHLKPSQKLIL